MFLFRIDIPIYLPFSKENIRGTTTKKRTPSAAIRGRRVRGPAKNKYYHNANFFSFLSFLLSFNGVINRTQSFSAKVLRCTIRWCSEETTAAAGLMNLTNFSAGFTLTRARTHTRTLARGLLRKYG